jgi:hypothetical protein
MLRFPRSLTIAQPSRPERSRSSICPRSRSWSPPMRRKRRKQREANRLSTCAHCRRPFAVCGSCDRGRLHCSDECAGARRREQLRRAGRHYQASERGRTAHAIRQARYRARKRAVTHPSSSAGSNTAVLASPVASAAQRTVEGPGQTNPLQAPSWAGAPPACARCGKSSGFLRNGFRLRPIRRIWRSSPDLRSPTPSSFARTGAVLVPGTMRVLHR